VLPYATDYNIVTSFGRPFAIGLLIAGSAFRGRGDTRTPMLVNLGMNILNIVGNYLLINPTRQITVFGLSFTMPGAGWGVAGAGIATSFSQICACTTLVILLFRMHNPYQISIKDSFKLAKALIKPVMSISWPAMLERLCMSSGGIVITSTIATLGTAVLAANTLYITAESLSFMPGFAFMTSITTMVGQSLGAKKPDLARRYTYLTILYSASLLSVIAVFLYIFAGNILSFFTPDQEVIAIATDCLHIVAFLQPFQVAAWVLGGALRGAGDTRFTFYTTAICSWGIRALGAALVIRVFGLGLQEAVMCMFADGVIRMIVLYLRFRSGKWEHAVKLPDAPESA
jgi:putative MATE family efflux protein